MGLSYLSIIRSRDVYLVHVCSQCHMAILSHGANYCLCKDWLYV